MPVTTPGRVPFVTVNGIQTLSHGLLELSAASEQLLKLGAGGLRIGVERGDAVAAARICRDLLDGRIAAAEAGARLRRLFPEADLLNRYGHPLVA